MLPYLITSINCWNVKVCIFIKDTHSRKAKQKLKISQYDPTISDKSFFFFYKCELQSDRFQFWEKIDSKPILHWKNCNDHECKNAAFNQSWKEEKVFRFQVKVIQQKSKCKIAFLETKNCYWDCSFRAALLTIVETTVIPTSLLRFLARLFSKCLTFRKKMQRCWKELELIYFFSCTNFYQ